MMTESHHKPGPAEMANLARRLRACAESVLRRDQPEQQRDSFTAGVMGVAGPSCAGGSAPPDRRLSGGYPFPPTALFHSDSSLTIS